MNWKDQTDDERRASVALLDGYTFHPENRRMKWSRDSNRISGGVFSVAPPDYLNDLDAMREVEQNHILCSIARKARYVELLDAYTMMNTNDSGHFASASIRAQAFLQTMGELI